MKNNSIRDTGENCRRYDRLNEAFQYVKDSFLDLVEQERVSAKKRSTPVWKFLGAAAACICLLLALPAAAIAYNWFGLKDLLLPEIPGEPAYSGPGKGFDFPGNDQIALSGYHTSPEARALAEWEEFLAGYDTDGRIAAEIGNGVFTAEGREDWSLYNVYSFEMGEKLDEIAGRYGLKLHREINGVSPEEMEYRVGGRFIMDSTNYWGYIYEDGTFFFDGDIDPGGCGTVSFQFGRTVKGSFQETVLRIGQAEDYQEWQYLSACGESALLALGTYKSLIFADFEECFIIVNVLAGSEAGITKENLQQLADKINFSLLKEVRTPDMRGDS